MAGSDLESVCAQFTQNRRELDSTASIQSKAEVGGHILQCFRDSLFYDHWKNVGYSHMLQNDDEIACFLLKYYENSTSAAIPSTSMTCTVCRMQLDVFCRTCGKSIGPRAFNHQMVPSGQSLPTVLKEDTGQSAGQSSRPFRDWKMFETKVNEEDEKFNRKNTEHTWRFYTSQPLPPHSVPSFTGPQQVAGDGNLDTGEASIWTGGSQSTFFPLSWQKRSTMSLTDQDKGQPLKLPFHFDGLDLCNINKLEHQDLLQPQRGHDLGNSQSDQSSVTSGDIIVNSKQDSVQDFSMESESSEQSFGKGLNLEEKESSTFPSPPSFSSISRKRGRPCLDSLQPRKSLQCSHCHRLYHSKQGLVMHLKLKHFIPTQNCLEPCILPIKQISVFKNADQVHRAREKYSGNLTPALNFECAECKFKVKTKKGLRHHIKLKHGSTLLCSVCLECFSSHLDFSQHIEIIHGKTQPVSECTVCHLTFPARSALRRHVHLKHRPGDVTLICTTCWKWFEKRQDLDNHMESSHSDSLFFLCESCGDSFPSKILLQKHKVGHQERLTCHLCGKSIFHRSWDDHMRRHKGERAWRCEVCHMTFVRKDELQLHGFIHNQQWPFCCEICGMRYRQKGSLTSHLRTHTGEKPYHCSHCEACFTRPRGLRDHLRLHTGERPYECAVCHRRFSNSGNLSTHRRTVHKLSPIPRNQQSAKHNLRYIGSNNLDYNDSLFQYGRENNV